MRSISFLTYDAEKKQIPLKGAPSWRAERRNEGCCGRPGSSRNAAPTARSSHRHGSPGTSARVRVTSNLRRGRVSIFRIDEARHLVAPEEYSRDEGQLRAGAGVERAVDARVCHKIPLQSPNELFIRGVYFRDGIRLTKREILTWYRQARKESSTYCVPGVDEVRELIELIVSCQDSQLHQRTQAA